jgi:hypothetical protein
MSFNVPIESVTFSQINRNFTNNNLREGGSLISNSTGMHIVIGVLSDATSSYIMKSSNSGVTFTTILAKTYWQDLDRLSRITMSDDGQNICVLNSITNANNIALVYYTRDGGTTWNLSYPLGTGAISNYNPGEIVSNSTGQYVVASTQNSSVNKVEIYFSSDYGASWRKSGTVFPTGLFIKGQSYGWNLNLTMDPTGQYVAMASLNNTSATGGIWLSSNYGSTWFSTTGVPFNVGYSDIKFGSSLLVAITSASTNKVWKANRDGSSAWSNMTSIPNDDYHMVYMSGTNIVLGSSTKLYIYKDDKNTLDKGVSYIINLQLTTFFYSICSDSSFTKFYFFSTQTNGAVPLRSSTKTNPTNITNIFKAKGTNTAAVTGYKINNADLNTLFAPIIDGVSIGYNTGYSVNGKDLSTIFASK